MPETTITAKPSLKALLAVGLLTFPLAQAATTLPIPATPLRTLPNLPSTTSIPSAANVPALPTKRAALPGQVQPVAPGTRTAPRIPELTLNPPIAQVGRIQYLSNGHIEVASAVVLLTPAEAGMARQISNEVIKRTFAARPALSEVDVSVYNKGTYGGFGGPLPLLTISAPRTRLAEVELWAHGENYDRAWEAGALPAAVRNEVIADKVKENSINFYGDVGDSVKEQNKRQVSRLVGGIQDGLLYMGKKSIPVVALTFDDAPHPMFEPLLLDLLRRGQVHATFFVIGRNAQAYPYFIRDMVAEGHEVANHTYHHVRLPGLPITVAAQELRQTDQVLQGITGQTVRFFRPPGGDYTAATLAAARAQGLTTVFWTDDPADFQNPGNAVLTNRFSRRLDAGGIILLHDNAPQTLEVFGNFLDAAYKRKLALSTVSGMLSARAGDKFTVATPLRRAAPAFKAPPYIPALPPRP